MPRAIDLVFSRENKYYSIASSFSQQDPGMLLNLQERCPEFLPENPILWFTLFECYLKNTMYDLDDIALGIEKSPTQVLEPSYYWGT